MNQPASENMHYYEMARQSSHNPNATQEVLDRVEPQVRAASETYRDSIQNQQRIDPVGLSKTDRDVLHQIYERLGGSDHGSGMRAAITQNRLNANPRCPYCDIGRARQIDHFLPKAAFPEYSVTVVNLVPACSDCNKMKGSAQFESDGSRYPHAYVDEVFAAPFLFAEILWVEGIPVVDYRLERCKGMTDLQFVGVSRQYSDLDLLARFGFEAQTELSESDFVEIAGTPAGRKQLRKIAEQKSSKLLALYGPNHRTTALYIGLSRSLANA